MRIRVAARIMDVPDYFISAHNRGKLVDSEAWEEFKEAKEIYKFALAKFADIYDGKEPE